jgi:hypothetical protein
MQSQFNINDRNLFSELRKGNIMVYLLRAEGILDTLASKTHLSFDFYLKKPVQRLNISFCYDPKWLDDKSIAQQLIEVSFERYLENGQEQPHPKWEIYYPLQNLITLSFDDPFRFRGAAHNPLAEQSHFITEKAASPGLLPGVLPAGIWRVTLSVHAIVTPKCRYRLLVWEGDQNEDQVVTQ